MMYASALLVNLLALPPYTPEATLTLKPSDNATATLDQSIATDNSTARTLQERIATGYELPANLLALSPKTPEAVPTLKPSGNATTILNENNGTDNAIATLHEQIATDGPSLTPGYKLPATYLPSKIWARRRRGGGGDMVLIIIIIGVVVVLFLCVAVVSMMIPESWLKPTDEAKPEGK